MEPENGKGEGKNRIPLSPETLLNALRPHCMATMAALEDILGSERDRAIPDENKADASAANYISKARRLEVTLSEYNSALRAVLRRSLALRPEDLQRAVTPTLPFVMLPLQLALAPASSTPPAPRGQGANGGVVLGQRGVGGVGKMPAYVREKALLCVAEAIRASGARFIEGYGLQPTLNVLVSLIFTLAECSPTRASTPAFSTNSKGGSGGSSGQDRGGGLTAGTEALSLACLECLEALLCAALDTRRQADSDSGTGADSSIAAAWKEVQNTLRTAVGGGLLAQLVQELLLCCQAVGGWGGKTADLTLSRSNGSRRGGGAREARSAAGCLDALCSFVSDRDVWKRFLPGTFSGLFRAIRGMEAKSSQSAGSLVSDPHTVAAPPALTAISSQATAGRRTCDGSGGGGSGGGSKSALAEMCLTTLAKVLLICAGSASAAVVSRTKEGAVDRTEEHGVEAAAGVSSNNREGNKHGVDEDSPLLVLKRLALTSNSATTNRAADRGARNSDRKSPSGKLPLPPAPLGTDEASSLSVAQRPPGAIVGQSSKRLTNTDDQRWESETSGRLRLLLPPLLAFCRLHPGWRVRRAAATFASSILAAGRGKGHWDEYGGSKACGNAEHEDNRVDLEGGGKRASLCVMAVDDRERVAGEGLLGPLTPLLIEALVGLALDDMPQVSSAATEGLSSFRSTLSPLRWLALRGLLLERLCAIAEGLPALARSADEKRLRGAFDLLAGYLSLLGTDARAALDARLPSVLSCLCEALEFDQDFNVQVLEGSHSATRNTYSSARVADAREDDAANGGVSQAEDPPKYYRQVLLNAREDTTLASARRAVRLLGKFCDMSSLADSALSAIEIPYPRHQRTRRSRRVQAPFDAQGRAERDGHNRQLVSSRNDAGEGVGAVGGPDDGLHRRRCLEWLRSRLPMMWVLNQAFVGLLPSSPASSTAKLSDESNGAARGSTADRPRVGRGLALAWLDRLLASQAFSLPVSRPEAVAGGYSDGGVHGAGGNEDPVGEFLPLGQSTNVVQYTRSGEVFGARRGGNVPGVSAQVLDANATMVSMVIETLAALAELYGPSVGEDYLRRVLYPLLEKAASTHPVVSQAALATLWRVQSACGEFQDMAQLLAANMDYIVDDVIRKVASARLSSATLRRAHTGRGPSGRSPDSLVLLQGGGSNSTGRGVGIAGVVEAVLRIGGSAMGPALVKDLAGVTLREVDACAWDPGQSSRSIGVLRAIVSCVSLPSFAPASPTASADLLTSNTATGSTNTAGDEDEAGSTGVGAKVESAGSSQKTAASFEDGSGGNDGGARRAAAPAFSQSPWFRQLFIEFADASDVRRTADDGGLGAESLLGTLQQHRQTMGFEDVDEPDKQAPDSEDGGDEDDEGALPEPDAEGRKMAESQEVKTLSEVLARSCHFMSTPSLDTQAAALACMRDCVLKLATAGASAALLPHVHKAWRPLMATFREFLLPNSSSTYALATAGGAGRSSSAPGGSDGVLFEPAAARKAVLLHALETVDALVDVCGDFMSIKVTEDLWPLLKVLLLQYACQTTKRETDSGRHINTVVKRRTSSDLLSTPSAQQQRQTILTGMPGLSITGNDTGSRLSLATASNTKNGAPHSGSLERRAPMDYLAMSATLGGSGRSGGKPSRQDVGSGRVGLLEAQVVTRALLCLKTMCDSSECEMFMTPLAREVALASLPCLSSAGPETIRSAAELLFENLAFLDGDAIWLLLTQTLDAAEEREPPPGVKSGIALGNGGMRSGGGRATGSSGGTYLDTTGKATRSREHVTSRAGETRESRSGRAKKGVEASENSAAASTDGSKSGLFFPCSPIGFLVPWLHRGRPCPLNERRSVFAGPLARKCAPAATRLLKFMNSPRVSEHM